LARIASDGLAQGPSTGARGIIKAMSADASRPSIEIGWVCADCNDPGTLATRWQALTGGEIRVDDDGDVHLDGGPVQLLVLRTPDERQVKNQLHFDLHVRDYEAARTKAIVLGASSADDISVAERWRVSRDPEGNEFCILWPKIEAR
jgi:Glyoxalase-like domain